MLSDTPKPQDKATKSKAGTPDTDKDNHKNSEQLDISSDNAPPQPDPNVPTLSNSAKPDAPPQPKPNTPAPTTQSAASEPVADSASVPKKKTSKPRSGPWTPPAADTPE